MKKYKGDNKMDNGSCSETKMTKLKIHAILIRVLRMKYMTILGPTLMTKSTTRLAITKFMIRVDEGPATLESSVTATP